jgi:DNA-binding response OmpR family regulator
VARAKHTSENATDDPLAEPRNGIYSLVMVQPRARGIVLVVDDDCDHLLMLEALLDAAGYTVLTATSCAEGRSLLMQRDVDALVADYSLGDGTASDLLRGLGHRRPRVALVLSGFDASEDVARTLDAGFDAHLVKPTSIDVLRETLAEGLRKSPSGIRLVSRSDESVGSVGSVPVAATGTHATTGPKRR